jgi:hypothetical protein
MLHMIPGMAAVLRALATHNKAHGGDPPFHSAERKSPVPGIREYTGGY